MALLPPLPPEAHCTWQWGESGHALHDSEPTSDFLGGAKPRALHVPKSPPWSSSLVPPHLLPLSLSLHFSHTTPLLFFDQAWHTLASGSLRLLFPLPGTLFLRTFGGSTLSTCLCSNVL